MGAQTSAKPTQGVWGLAPRKETITELMYLFNWDSSFSRKRSKKRCSASQKGFVSPKLGEADPGGSGGHAPQKRHELI
jgi:hypothetical protein